MSEAQKQYQKLEEKAVTIAIEEIKKRSPKPLTDDQLMLVKIGIGCGIGVLIRHLSETEQPDHFTE